VLYGWHSVNKGTLQGSDNLSAKLMSVSNYSIYFLLLWYGRRMLSPLPIVFFFSELS
jgi:hypothetical protein